MEKEIEEKIKELIKEKNYKEIITICNEILNKNEDEKAYFHRGTSKYYLKEYKEAIKNHSKVIELNPNNENSYLQRGNCKEYIKEYKEAIKDYNKAIKLNPNNKNIYGNRGNCKYNLRQYKAAIKDYDEVIKLYPDNEKAYNNIGLSKARLKLYKESVEKAYYNKGLAKAKLKLYKESVECYNKAIELNTKCYYAYYNRYISKYNLEEYKEAIEDFNKLIELLKKLKLIKKYNLDISFIFNMFIDIMRIIDIEYIFKLIKENYKELFENDTIFKLLKNKIESKDISNKDDIFNNVKEILFYQYLLLKSLSFNINDNIEISHYTSLNTLLLLLNDKKEYKNKEKYKNEKEDKENKENEGKIRIVNISNANDPKEGKILESIFNKNGLDIKISDNEETLITLQTSFSRNKDSLTMFRLYGKNENKEATGICLVIDKEYFNDKYFSTPVQESSILTNDKNSNENEEEQIDNLKRNLFWILYYNEKENKLIFSSENSKYKNIIIDLKNIKNKDRFKKIK